MLNYILLFIFELFGKPGTFDDQQYCIPPLLIVAGALAAHSARMKYQQGKKQEKEADKLAQTPRPARVTSPYLLQNRNMAANIAGSELPGSGLLRSRLDRIISNSANSAVNAGAGSAGILSTISGATNSAMDQEAGLTAKGAEYRMGGQRLLMGANSVLAGEDQQNFDWNSKQKYLDAMYAASSLRNAAILNKQNARDSASKIPLMFMGNGAGAASQSGSGGSGGSIATGEENRSWGSGTQTQIGSGFGGGAGNKTYADFMEKSKTNPSLTWDQYMTM